MTSKFLAGLLVSMIGLVAPAIASTPAVSIVTPLYTLTCSSQMQHRKQIVLTCVPSHTPATVRHSAFANWQYGQPLPKAIFVDTPVGGGSAPPQITAADTSIIVGGSLGAPTLQLGTTQPNANTWSALQTFAGGANFSALTASSALCLDVSKNVTTTGCASGGDTITTPNSTLTIGGTSSATTLDLNLANANTWTATQTHSAPIVFSTIAMTDPATSSIFTDVYGNLFLEAASTKNITLKNKLSSSSLGIGMSVASLSGLGHEGFNNATSLAAGGATCPNNSCDGLGTVTLSSANPGVATVTFHTPYSATPVCQANDQTAAAAVKIVPSTTTVVFTGTTSDVIGYRCAANGGA